MIVLPNSDSTILPPIKPTEARYIRLGPENCWAETCIETNTMRFGFPDEPHDLCLAGDWKGAEDVLQKQGKRRSDVSRLMRELRDFYSLGSDVLWITLVDRRLWWAFSEADVIDLRDGEDGAGLVARRTLGPWRCRTVHGQVLEQSSIDEDVVRIRGFPTTIRTVTDVAAVCRAINVGTG